jgi:hypothetical protein
MCVGENFGKLLAEGNIFNIGSYGKTTVSEFHEF